MPQPKADKNDSKRDCHIVFEGQEAGDRRELVPGIFFRWCPAGTFAMGSPETEPRRGTDENEVSVTLTKGFWLGETEVTQGEWQKVMGTNPSAFRKGGSGADKLTGVPDGDLKRFPVESISWNDCQVFLKKLKDLWPELAFRLPTEAEWEYACRAGSTTEYNFGEDEAQADAVAWDRKNSGLTSHPVGEKKPSKCQ